MYWIEFVVLELLFGLISVLWFKNGNLIIGHDSSVYLTPIHNFLAHLFSWNPQINFGTDWSIVNTRAFLLLKWPETLFYSLTSNIYISEFITCVFWLSIMGLGIYLYVRDLFPDKRYWFIRVFSTLFFVVNFYILQAWLIFERAKFSLYAALPLGLLLIRTMVRQEKFLLKYPIYFGLLFLFLNGGGEPPLYGAILVAFPVYALCYLLFFLRDRKMSFKVVAAYVVSSAVIALLLNAYYLLPYIQVLKTSLVSTITKTGGIQSFIAWENTISGNASLTNLFRLQGIPDWYNNPAHPYANQFILKRSLIALSFVPIFVILSGLNFSKWKKLFTKAQVIDISILFFIFILGLLFTGGTHAPFGQLYLYAMEHIPGFIIFRSSFYKFAPLIWLPVAILTSVFLTAFMEDSLKQKSKFILSILLCFGLLLYHYPYFDPSAFNFRQEFSTHLKLPTYTVEMANTLKRVVPTNGRILLYPPLDMGYIGQPLDTYTWGYYSFDPYPRIISEKTIVANDSYQLPMIETVQQALHDGNSDELLRIATTSSITHVLWRGDVKRSEAMDRDIPLSEMEQRLASMSALKKEVQSGSWTLYQVDGLIKPMIYAQYPDGSERTYIKSYQSMNPTLYRITTNATATASIALVLNQQFNEGWRAVAHQSNERWIRLNNHTMVNGFANAWEINIPDVTSITIEYVPQRYFYFGLGITGATLIGIGVYFVIAHKRRIIRKRKI